MASQLSEEGSVRLTPEPYGLPGAKPNGLLDANQTDGEVPAANRARLGRPFSV